MDEKKLLPLIFDFCKKNPGKKPISLIDKLIDETAKIEGKWKSGTVPWAADDASRFGRPILTRFLHANR